jgi:hypothetical protein
MSQGLQDQPVRLATTGRRVQLECPAPQVLLGPQDQELLARQAYGVLQGLPEASDQPVSSELLDRAVGLLDPQDQRDLLEVLKVPRVQQELVDRLVLRVRILRLLDQQDPQASLDRQVLPLLDQLARERPGRQAPPVGPDPQASERQALQERQDLAEAQKVRLGRQAQPEWEARPGRRVLPETQYRDRLVQLALQALRELAELDQPVLPEQLAHLEQRLQSLVPRVQQVPRDRPVQSDRSDRPASPAPRVQPELRGQLVRQAWDPPDPPVNQVLQVQPEQPGRQEPTRMSQVLKASLDPQDLKASQGLRERMDRLERLARAVRVQLEQREPVVPQVLLAVPAVRPVHEVLQESREQLALLELQGRVLRVQPESASQEQPEPQDRQDLAGGQSAPPVPQDQAAGLPDPQDRLE